LNSVPGLSAGTFGHTFALASSRVPIENQLPVHHWLPSLTAVSGSQPDWVISGIDTFHS